MWLISLSEKKNFIKKVFLSAVAVAFMLTVIPPVRFWELDIYSRFDGYLRIYLSILILITFLLRLVIQKRVEPAFLLLGMYCMTLVYSTFVHGGSLKDALWSNTFIPMILVCAIDLLTDEDTVTTVKTLCFIYGAVILINALTVISFFEKDLNISDLADYAFLGNRNSFVFYYLIYLLCGYYGIEKGYLHRKWIYPAVYFICVITTVISGGLTIAFVLAIWGIFLFFRYLVGFRRKVSFGIILVIIALLFAVTQVYDGKNISFISRLLIVFDKNVYFSSRVPIWKATREWIKESPVIGYGMVDYVKMVTNAHPHNLYLDIVFRCGSIGAAIILIIYFILGRQVKKINNTGISMGFTAFMFCLMVESLFDMIDLTYYYLYMSLLFFFVRNEFRSEAES